MTKTAKDYLFGAFGISCKLLFFMTSLITTYYYNKTICLVLSSIFVLHNVVAWWYMKGKRIKISME